MVSGIIQGLQGGFIAILFSLDKDTRKRLSWANIKNGIKYNILKFEDTVEYPAHSEDEDEHRLTDNFHSFS